MKTRITIQALEETQGSKRLDIWPDYIRQFDRYALIGMGLDRSIEAIRDSYTADSSHPLIPHQTYLQILVEFGFIGLLLFIGGFWQLGKRAAGGPRGERAVILGLLAALITYGLAGSLLGERAIWLALGVIAFSGLKHPLPPNGKRKSKPAAFLRGNGEDKSLTILMVLPHLQKGGAERQMSYLVEELSRREHRIHVATLQKSEDWELLGQPGITHHRLRSRNNYDPLILIQLIKLINHLRPVVIHTWILQMDIIGGLAALITGQPWITRESSSAAAYSGTWKGRLRAFLVGRADAVVANSPGGIEYWRLLHPSQPRYLIPNGLPLKKIAGILPLSQQQIGLKDSQKLILYAGRLTRQKRVGQIITALAALKPDVNAAFFICGKGEVLEELKKQAQRLGVENQVIFRGFLKMEMIWAMMKSADLFINLSNFEGMPNTVMEAMACHCPLLVSDISAHREFLDEGNASLVDPDNLKAVTRALQTSLTDREEAQKHAHNAAKKAAGWSIARLADAYELVYREVIASRKKKRLL
ncbi:MAG TPA: glycosyltransferase [Proteobacteria bacterium]|nr:glycosyltransferase [Pseudomonadota bacterium]